MTGNSSSLMVCSCSRRYLSDPQKYPLRGVSQSGLFFLFNVFAPIRGNDTAYKHTTGNVSVYRLTAFYAKNK